jgi:hypothetical protein
MRAGILRGFLFWNKNLNSKPVYLKIDHSPADGEQILEICSWYQVYAVVPDSEPQREKIPLCGSSLLWTISCILCYIL